jgi:hypothetical protein
MEAGEVARRAQSMLTATRDNHSIDGRIEQKMMMRFIYLLHTYISRWNDAERTYSAVNSNLTDFYTLQAFEPRILILHGSFA